MQRIALLISALIAIILIPSALHITQSKLPKVEPLYYSKEDIYWMAKNVYYEAGNQSGDGLLAVMHVTMNRVNDGRFGNSIKEVVTQKTGNVCQFSWYCSKSLKYDDKKFLEVYEFVKAVLPFLHLVEDATEGALYFHATYVKPYWSKIKQRTIKIGDHIFYRENIVK
jgi:spore germination cell wall hydrolase CwlJ-like protein